MSILTTITIKRNGAVIEQQVPVQIDNTLPQIAAQSGGESPYDLYDLLTLGRTVDLRRQDLLIDEQNIDPATQEFTIYRVLGNPESFTVLAHTEAQIEKFYGEPTL